MMEARELRGERSRQAKTYCLYEASDAEAIREAARRLNALANVIVEVGNSARQSLPSLASSSTPLLSASPAWAASAAGVDTCAAVRTLSHGAVMGCRGAHSARRILSRLVHADRRHRTAHGQ
jgi:hypothetical protein